MRAAARCLCSIALIAHLAGCSTYRTVACLPPAAPPADVPGAHQPAATEPWLAVLMQNLRAGDRIRVTLDDGSRHTGRFVTADARRLHLEDDEQWTAIDLASVVQIDKRSTDVVATTVLVLGTAAATFVTVFALNWDYPSLGPASNPY